MRNMKRFSIQNLLSSEGHENFPERSHGPHSYSTVEFRYSTSQKTPSQSHSENLRPNASSTTRAQLRRTAEEDQILKTVIADNARKSNKILESLPCRAGKQCRKRWLIHPHPDLRKGKWARWEDRIILHEQSVETSFDIVWTMQVRFVVIIPCYQGQLSTSS